MRSVYVVGAAGAGKSTFTRELLEGLGAVYGPLEDLASLPNRKALVTLRGHRLEAPNMDPGMYLGVQRESFPGTDGLDRASSPVGEAWLREGSDPAQWLVGEGATLSTTRFLAALQQYTDLLLVHLKVDPEEAERRFAQRGSEQNPKFVLATRTRSANRTAELAEVGAKVLTVDTTDPEAWQMALDICELHLQYRQRWIL